MKAALAAGDKLALICDVGDPARIEEAAATILDRFGRCDIFGNNELGDKGVTVNVIAPTVVKTEGSAERLPSDGPRPTR